MHFGPGTNPNKKKPRPLCGGRSLFCTAEAVPPENHLQFLLSVALVVRLVLRCWVPLVVFFWVPLVVLVVRLVVLFV